MELGPVTSESMLPSQWTAATEKSFISWRREPVTQRGMTLPGFEPDKRSVRHVRPGSGEYRQLQFSDGEGSGGSPPRPVASRVKPRAHGTRTEQRKIGLHTIAGPVSRRHLSQGVILTKLGDQMEPYGTVQTRKRPSDQLVTTSPLWFQDTASK